MASFTYMGTKKSLAGIIGSLCQQFGSGPFLDLFSGISAVGASIAPSRQIWCNDAQVFSRTLTEALYLSVEDAPRVQQIATAVQRLGNKNLSILISAAQADVDEELMTLWDGSTGAQIALQGALLATAQERRAAWSSVYSHCLFSTLYAGSYFGLVQAMQIDSIRYGADTALSGGLISTEEHRWAVLAICRAASAISNSTGHFAQYLTPSEKNVHRVVSKRRRCAWAYWLNALEEMKPVGGKSWRGSNRVFHGDAVDVLRYIKREQLSPAIIYADPPYTNDQYSRYYHLLETVVLYDYPDTDGKGLYRRGRFRSSFSLAGQVEGSFRDMIAAAAKTGSSLMISYPSNGLLTKPLCQIPAMMSDHFSLVDDPIVIPHRHSTLGGSKGREKEDVEECIFIGKHPRSV